MPVKLLQLLLVMVLIGSAAAGGSRAKDAAMWMTVGEKRFAISLADTPAARAFAERLPLTLDMPDLNANEKHATLAKPLPANSTRPGTIRSGDIMLYGTNTLVVFYVTFESTYSYTRIGRVDDASRLAQTLGSGTVRVVFSKD